jgi:hypothetical protein|tara:strand:- start:410 stop:619 length:210 start_codon:yes stop_codon:yes gene_type:complete
MDENINVAIYKDDIKRLQNMIEILKNENMKKSIEIIDLNKEIDKCSKSLLLFGDNFKSHELMINPKTLN